MNIAHICILIACCLPIVCAGLAKRQGFGKSPRKGGYDNHHPRQWLAQLEGSAARANAAQQNSFEALPIFIAGILVAQYNGASEHALMTINGLAIAFVVLRITYIFAYVNDRATLRSIVWMLAFLCAVLLFFVQ